MVFPLYDDNSDRTTTPIVNYVLIAINILVFVFLQQLGTNERFTYAFSTVPQEIVSGRDIRTPDRRRGASSHRPGAFASRSAADAIFRLPHVDHFDVHARRHRAHRRQHALSLDLWRQPRRPAGPRPVSDLLSCLRRARLAGSRVDHGHVCYRSGQFVDTEPGRVGSDLGCAWWLHRCFIPHVA